jgi:hypothetical protein
VVEGFVYVVRGIYHAGETCVKLFCILFYG